MILSETKIYGGRLIDRLKLSQSSSGGAFTALSDVFLSQGNAVVCSSYNYNNNQQEFHLITTKEKRDNARGSMYFQSIPGNIFSISEKWLDENPQNELVFFGMGCQAAGFLSYVESKGHRNRVTIVDIICHGSPSPQIWREYIDSVGNRFGSFDKITFKDKRKGWNSPTAIAIRDSIEFSLDKYVKMFYSNNALRPCCYKCPYAAIERNVDVTIGDFWHIEETIPEQYDEMGTSLFLIHTEKGMKLFDQAKENLIWFESNSSDCWQLNLERPTAESGSREIFWKEYSNKGIKHVISKYGTDTMIEKTKKLLRKCLNWGAEGID